MMKKLFLAMMFVGILSLAACGAAPAANDAEPMAPPAPVLAPEATMDWADDDAFGGAFEMEMMEADFDFDYYTAYAPAFDAIEPVAAARMLVQRAWLEMAAEDFDEAVANLRNAPAAFGGYIESSSLSQAWASGPDFEVEGMTRIFDITMRVPVARFEEAQRHVEGYGEVLRLTQTTDDVTGQFVDVQRRMEAMLVQEDRLLELVDQAANLHQIFTIEDRLRQVRTQIEMYRGNMEGMGDAAAFSTIGVQLWEILEEEEEEEAEAHPFGERISNTFNTSASIVGSFLQGLVLFLTGAFLPLLVLGAIAVPIVLIVRFFTKRAAAKPPKHVAYPPHYAPYPQQYYNAETPQGAPPVEKATEEVAEATKEDGGEKS
ncbi:MAG: DUF4349 domain-containing protein [Clostridiales bacterium]|jgi:hypothetical protein|nr:DUF4349 domain-containing protein [Clostridiales bacterium]